MAATLGDALPADVLQRETKASFDEPFWGPESSGLAARWAGEGADPDVVDAPALRQEWSRPVPDAHTYTLLQAAWLELVPSSENLAATADDVGDGASVRGSFGPNYPAG
jgi:hypothetical protein